MDKTFLFFAPRRSGHHSVINWVAKQSKESVAWNDNCGFELFVDGKIKPKQNIKRYHQDNKNRNVMYNFENFLTTEEITSSLLTDDVTYIIILRDVYNFLASYMRWREYTLNRYNHYEYYEDNINLWIRFATEILNEDSKFYPILFNDWFSDRRYREYISEDLDLNNSDPGINEVMPNAGGSSFDKMRYRGKASEMEVLTRYKTYMENELYVKLLNNFPEAHELNKQIFGFNIEDIK